MRKAVLALLSLSLCLALTAPVFAQQEQVVTEQGYVVFRIGDPRCFVKGPNAEKFGPQVRKRPAQGAPDVTVVNMDVAPYIRDGRTFVPVRFLANALGVADANVSWDGSIQQATLAEPGMPVVQMIIGSRVIASGGQEKEIDAAPELADPPGRTMLPARFVAEALGYQVDWDKDNQIVIVWRSGPRPEVPEQVQREVQAWTWTPGGYQVPSRTGELVDQKLSAEYSTGVYWTKAGLEIDVKDGSTGLELGLLIMPPDYKGSWEAYDQAEAILASKLGPDFASEVMAYVRQKKSWRDMYGQSRIFYAPTGHSVVVDVGEGAQIEVWPPGVRPPGY